MDAELRDQLVSSIIDANLVVVAGAGLSMCGDSGVPSAAALAAEYCELYLRKYAQRLPADFLHDLEGLSRHFYEEELFQRRFIPLIPWHRFRNGQPNTGHEAIADFLACKAIPLAITTNYDTLVETAAGQLGEPDFCPMIDPAKPGPALEYSPYLKLHGCALLSRTDTLWCKEQLEDENVSRRLADAATYLQNLLRGKDLLFVGFWTDWSYLNELIEQAVDEIEPSRVVLVDPADAGYLEEKAPRLWEWSNSDATRFFHVQESADDFLRELRVSYSVTFLQRLILDSRGVHEAVFGQPAELPDLAAWPTNIEALYSVRRDLTGTAAAFPVRSGSPDPSFRSASATLSFLLSRGAIFTDNYVTLADTRIRVVAGQGVPLSVVKAQHFGAVAVIDEDMLIICAGAINDSPAKPNIVRDHEASSVIRPGLSGTWITLEDAIEQLGN